MATKGKYSRRSASASSWGLRIAGIAIPALALGMAGMGLAQVASASIGVPSGVAVAVADTNVAVGQGSFTVTWRSVNGAVAYSVVAYYAGTTSIARSQTVVAPATTAVLDRLTGGERYDVSVAATDGSTYGGYSDPISKRALTVPTPPQSVNAEYDRTASQTTVSWVRPSSTGGSDINAYEIYTDGSLAETVSGQDLSGSVPGNYSVDRLAVRAINAVGSSDQGTTASVPGPPRSLQTSSSGSTVSLSWLAPLDNGGAAVSGYVADLRMGGLTQYQGQVGASNTALDFDGVANGTYSVVVRAINAAGPGAIATGSVSVSASPTPPAPGQVPGPPTNVTAIAGSGEATVAWTPPASVGSFPITSYRVTSSPGGKVCLAAASPCVVKGLTGGTAYTFTVSALNGAGYGPESAPSGAVTPTPGPTPSPTPTPTPTPSPTPSPTPADVQLPQRVLAVRGEVTRIVMTAEGRVPLRALGLSVRVNGRAQDLEAQFTRRGSGDIRAQFEVRQRPGSYGLVLMQDLSGKRVVLDRSTLVVTRR